MRLLLPATRLAIPVATGSDPKFLSAALAFAGSENPLTKALFDLAAPKATSKLKT
jgi:hypothetical protein